MTLVIELTPEEEARLEAASQAQGVDAATYAKQVLTDHLPTQNTLNLEEFDRVISEIARQVSSIPHDKQTREYIYED